MNLTHNNKQGRDYLGPVNTNITYTTEHTINSITQKQKEIPINQIRSQSQTKNDSQTKFQSLHTIIDSLRYENQSMNAMVRTKNQQIVNLKALLKSQGIGPQSNNPQNKVIRQIYHLNSFRQPTGEPQSLNSVQLDKAAHQIRILTKQRDDLKKYCQQLQQQQNKTVTQIITQPIQSQIPNKIQNIPTQVTTLPIDSISKQQHKKIVQQYQQHIASMAGKLSTVHKLQLENTQLTQQRTNILNDFEGMRQQLVNRIGYCQHLESDLRFLEQQLNKRGGINNLHQQGNHQGNQGNADYQNILNKNVFLQAEMTKLQKSLAEKQEKLTEIQLRSSGYVQVTKQAFESMQKNINTLQEKVNIATEGQRKQAEKYTNIQIQLNKVNRQLADKARKTEVDSEQVKKLEAQRNQNTTNLAKAKAQLKQMEKKYQDKAYQVEKLTADLQKSKKLSTLTQDYITEVQMQKKRAKQSDELVKKMKQRVSSIEQNYRKVLRQNEKATQFVQESKKKWQKYQKIIKEQNQRINTLNERNTKRLQELDINIKNGINLQDKLRQLTRRNQSLTDEIEQCIKQNYYVKTPDNY